MNLTSPTVIKGLMADHNLRFAKRFGQNFLIDQNMVERIADASEAGPEDVVVEIGPGIGTLTRALADRAKKVYAVEIDKRLIPVLEETLSDKENVEVIQGDILKVDLFEILKDEIESGATIRIAANLPYYITTPIIMNLLESELPVKSMSFLIQKEVADRMGADPGSKTYGSLSVIAQYYADVLKAFDVPASVFMPRPNVESAVVTLNKKDTLPELEVEAEDYFKVIKAAFANRRKTILNTLSHNLEMDKKTVTEKLEAIGIDPGSRAERLSGKDYENIAKALLYE